MGTEEVPDTMAGTGMGAGTITSRSITLAGISASEAATANAAKVLPVSGSVTQSSDSSSPNPSGSPVSNDIVNVTIGYDGTNLTYRATYNGREAVDTAGSDKVDQVEHRVNEAVGTQKHAFFEYETEYGTWRSAEFYRRLSPTDVDDLEDDLDGTNVVSAQLWVDIYTDYEGTADTDYLAGGIWVYRADDASSLEDYEYGAFMDGSDPFEQANLARLTGGASYVGDATGVYADARDTGRNYFFAATVKLTANFDNDTIAGQIDTFKENGALVPGSPILTLASTSIGNTDSGFFTGETSVSSYDGDNYTGKWGGQFYGNSHSSGQPGSVGGTFGGATEGGYKGFLGVFGAHYDENQ